MALQIANRPPIEEQVRTLVLSGFRRPVLARILKEAALARGTTPAVSPKVS
jgi:hypothetical protein